jgi:hypothetical protein
LTVAVPLCLLTLKPERVTTGFGVVVGAGVGVRAGVGLAGAGELSDGGTYW